MAWSNENDARTRVGKLCPERRTLHLGSAGTAAQQVLGTATTLRFGEEEHLEVGEGALQRRSLGGHNQG